MKETVFFGMKKMQTKHFNDRPKNNQNHFSLQKPMLRPKMAFLSMRSYRETHFSKNCAISYMVNENFNILKNIHFFKKLLLV